MLQQLAAQPQPVDAIAASADRDSCAALAALRLSHASLVFAAREAGSEGFHVHDIRVAAVCVIATAGCITRAVATALLMVNACEVVPCRIDLTGADMAGTSSVSAAGTEANISSRLGRWPRLHTGAPHAAAAGVASRPAADAAVIRIAACHVLAEAAAERLLRCRIQLSARPDTARLFVDLAVAVAALQSLRICDFSDGGGVASASVAVPACSSIRNEWLPLAAVCRSLTLDAPPGCTIVVNAPQLPSLHISIAAELLVAAAKAGLLLQLRSVDLRLLSVTSRSCGPLLCIWPLLTSLLRASACCSTRRHRLVVCACGQHLLGSSLPRFGHDA